MEEKIKSSFSNYDIDFKPTSSYLTGDIVKINVPYAANFANDFSAKVDEMDLRLTNNGELAENSTSEGVSSSQKFIEELRTSNNEEIEKIRVENNNLIKKYQDFINNIPNNSKEVDFFINYSFGELAQYNTSIASDMYNNQIDEYNLRYIKEHSQEFENFMGMSLDEYNQKIADNELTINVYQIIDYDLKQQLKEIPYKEIMKTADYENYILNLKDEDKKPRLPEYTPPTMVQYTEFDNKIYDSYSIAYQNKIADLEYLLEEQIYMYNYLFDTRGESAAFEYLKAIEDKINQTKGETEAQIFFSSITDDEGNVDVGYLEYTLKTVSKGFWNGIENFGEGLEHFVNPGSDGIRTDNDYAKKAILNGLEALQENGQLFPSTIATYNVSFSTGNYFPAALASVVTGNQKVGDVLVAISKAGNAKNKALTNYDVDTAKAYAYATYVGLTSYYASDLIKKLPGLSGKTTFVKALQGGTKASVTNYTDSLVESILFGKEFDLGIVTQESLNEFVGAFFSSLLATGGHKIFEKLTTCEINFCMNNKKYHYDNLRQFLKSSCIGILHDDAGKVDLAIEYYNRIVKENPEILKQITKINSKIETGNASELLNLLGEIDMPIDDFLARMEFDKNNENMFLQPNF